MKTQHWLATTLLLTMVLSGCPGGKSADGYLRDARSALDAGEFPDALGFAEQAHTQMPENPDARLILAEAHRRLGERDEAEGNLDGALSHYVGAGELEVRRAPRHDDWMAATRVARDLGKEPKDLATFALRAVEANPNSLEARLEAANLLDESGRAQDSVGHYLWAWEADRSNVNLGIRLGTIYLTLEEYEDAEAIFRRILEVEPGNVQASLKRADAFEALDRAARARRLYETLLRKHPDNPSLLFRYAEFLDRNGSPRKAESLRARARGELPGVKRRRMRKLR